MALFAKTTTLDLRVEGMTCASCVHHVTEALESVPGVKNADVDLEHQKARVKAKADTDVGALIAAVQDAGYSAEPTA